MAVSYTHLNAISGAMLLLKLASLYFLVVALFALKKPKPIPRANPNMRFACVIAARNEERVIGGLIESLLRQTYPKALFDIYVMPNNCTDHTALAAIRAGAQVLRPEGEIDVYKRQGKARWPCLHCARHGGLFVLP